MIPPLVLTLILAPDLQQTDTAAPTEPEPLKRKPVPGQGPVPCLSLSQGDEPEESLAL